MWGEHSGRDGYVSIEVHPRLAHNASATAAEAERLHALIDRPNLLVKIPATAAGLVAVEEMIACGRSINVALIFSLTRYAEWSSVTSQALSGWWPPAATRVASPRSRASSSRASTSRPIGG